MPGVPVVLLHGFTQTHVSWRPVVEAFSPHLSVIAPDLPGHGEAHAIRTGLADTAAALATSLGEAIYVGYSMGGRLALRLAIDHPAVVRGLVLIGATAGIDDPVERAARRESDEALAQRIESSGVEPFIRGWLDQPLFAGFNPEPDDLAARRGGDAAGLASSLRLSGTGTMDPPWWEELGDVECRTVVMAGESDTKFTALGRRLVAEIPRAELVTVAGAGHACHLERPDTVERALTDTLGGVIADT